MENPWNSDSVSSVVIWDSWTNLCKLWLFLPWLLFPSGFLAARGWLGKHGSRAPEGSSWGQLMIRVAQDKCGSTKNLPSMHSGARVANLAAPSPRIGRCVYSAEIHRKDSGLWRLHVVQHQLLPTYTPPLFSHTHLHTGSLIHTHH